MPARVLDHAFAQSGMKSGLRQAHKDQAAFAGLATNQQIIFILRLLSKRAASAFNCHP